ncbi:MAG: hypothetical protein RR458_05415 [Clostridia bacterium]
MLKTGCIFNREEISAFFKKANAKIGFDNYTMFFALYDNDEIIGMLKMYPDNTRCRIEKAVKLDKLTDEMEEFLLKSAINYALTFNTKQLICDSFYEKILEPMNFVMANGDMIGDTERIDFPSKCGCNHK